MIAAVLLGGFFNSAYANEVGDTVPTQIVCTKAGITPIMAGAKISQDAAETAAGIAVTTGECLYRPPAFIEVKLKKRVEVFADYDGDVVSVWELENDTPVFTWLVAKKENKPSF